MGDVAFFIDKSKRLPLNALRGPEVRDYEILCVRGRLKGVKREIVAFSSYFPPKIPKAKMESIMETLTDAISEAKAKTDNPWLIVGADWNRYDTSSITKAFPDMVKRVAGPTRKDALLDYLFTNFTARRKNMNYSVCFFSVV